MFGIDRAQGLTDGLATGVLNRDETEGVQRNSNDLLATIRDI